ncbi:hypothetical protein MCM47_27600 [Kitasatospora sp. A2-31]|nr:hypothetical protein [Kitasatospora sp. A2-31]
MMPQWVRFIAPHASSNCAMTGWSSSCGRLLSSTARCSAGQDRSTVRYARDCTALRPSVLARITAKASLGIVVRTRNTADVPATCSAAPASSSRAAPVRPAATALVAARTASATAAKTASKIWITRMNICSSWLVVVGVSVSSTARSTSAGTAARAAATASAQARTSSAGSAGAPCSAGSPAAAVRARSAARVRASPAGAPASVAASTATTSASRAVITRAVPAPVIAVEA